MSDGYILPVVTPFDDGFIKTSPYIDILCYPHRMTPQYYCTAIVMTVT